MPSEVILGMRLYRCVSDPLCLGSGNETRQPMENELSSEGVGMSGALPLQPRSRTCDNVSEECVYVSTVDSQWKLGGFETARHFKKIDTSVS